MVATGDEKRTNTRADELLPEEAAAGTDDPQAQAAAVLADSDERQAERDETEDIIGEHRSSDETVEP